jgi:M6 family metalloprotease-like protein
VSRSLLVAALVVACSPETPPSIAAPEDNPPTKPTESDTDISWAIDTLAIPEAICVQGNPQGDQRILVLLGDDDEVGQAPPSRPDAESVLADAELWFAAASYGKYRPTFDIYGWYDLSPNTGTVYALLSRAATEGVNVADYQRIVRITTSGNGGGSSTAGLKAHSVYWVQEEDGSERIAAVSNISGFTVQHSPVTIIHELGHSLCLPHTDSISSITGAHITYGNRIDPMGGHPSGLPVAGHYSSHYKQLLGWLGPEDSAQYQEPGTMVLAALESDQGIRSLRIARDPIAEGPLAGQPYYYIEARRPHPVVPVAHYNTADGVLIYTVGPDENMPYSWKGSGIDATPETPHDLSTDYALMPGRSIVLDARWVVTALESTSTGAKVAVRERSPDNSPPEVTSVLATPSGDCAWSLRAEASDADDDPISYAWFTNKSRGNRPGVGAYEPGNYASGAEASLDIECGARKRVFLVASDRRGGETWGYVDLNGYENEAPALDPIAVTGNAYVGFTFAAPASDQEALTYAWDFGDGETSTLPQPTHVFASGGLHEITVVVTDHEFTATQSYSLDTTADPNEPPVAITATTVHGAAGETITLDASTSFDPDDYPEPLTYFWRAAMAITLDDPRRPITEATLPYSSGEYDVVLTVSDGHLSATATVVIMVE